MAHELPELDYPQDALAPHISAETMSYHYGKHHAGYVKKLNAAVEGSPFAELDVEATIKKAHAEGNRGVFNNAAQHFNHSFYWKGLSPTGGGEPTGKAADAIKASYGTFDSFKAAFSKEAAGHFGSGWAWLVQDTSGNLKITSTHDADTPIAHGQTPLLTCDVWEHAYYVDYRNGRGDYIAAFWNLVNWDFVSSNL